MTIITIFYGGDSEVIIKLFIFTFFSTLTPSLLVKYSLHVWRWLRWIGCVIVGDSLSWSGNITPALTSHHCPLSLQPKDKLTQNVNKFWNSSGNSENWKTYQLSFETEGKNQIELKEENRTVKSFISYFFMLKRFSFQNFIYFIFYHKTWSRMKKVQKSEWIFNDLFSFEFDMKFDIN